MIDFRIHPKDEEDRAYAEGLEARENDVPRSANPYRPGTEREDQWDTGWTDADADLTAEDE